MNNKIGIGIISYKRPEFFKACIDSIPDGIGAICVVNDDPAGYPRDIYPKKIKQVLQHSKNLGVACAKNNALRYLIQDGCDHLFLIEEDQQILDPKIFETYIKYSEKTGLWHWNFYGHGPANKTPDGIKNPRQIIDYGEGFEVGFFPNCIGAFSYYLKNIIRAVGYMDERFSSLRCWEHVEHTHRIIKAGLAPAFWWFNDILNSEQFIQEQQNAMESSVIRHNNEEWNKNMNFGTALYQHLHGNIPTKVPDTSPENLIEILNNIQKTYSRKVL
jgi:GT2 family glycosyltransferase